VAASSSGSHSPWGNNNNTTTNKSKKEPDRQKTQILLPAYVQTDMVVLVNVNK
jgi:hypothetical protein